MADYRQARKNEQRAVEMYDAGRSRSEIAEELGVSVSRVSQMLVKGREHEYWRTRCSYLWVAAEKEGLDPIATISKVRRVLPEGRGIAEWHKLSVKWYAEQPGLGAKTLRVLQIAKLMRKEDLS